MKNVIYTLSTGDNVILNSELKTISIMFNEQQKVLSTSLLNGAYHEDLLGVFNHNCGDDSGDHCKLKASTYFEHLRVLAKEIGFSSDCVTGMGTAAQMENVAIVEKKYRDITVTAIVTGGIEGNGGRVGDPANYYAPQEKLADHKPGTINIILVLDADMSSGTMTRALVTCTEAKTAALQELMAGSLYSNGLATGSGTDQTIIIANSKSSLYFDGAGKHSKIGELIGIAVKEAVKKALYKQTGLSPDMQYSLLRRWKRFGVCEKTLWQYYCKIDIPEKMAKVEFNNRLKKYDKNSVLVIYSTLYIHLLDQLIWGLLPLSEVRQVAQDIMNKVAAEFNIEIQLIKMESLDDLVLLWQRLIIKCLVKGNC